MNTAVAPGREVKTVVAPGSAVTPGRGVKTVVTPGRGVKTAVAPGRGVMTAVVHGRGVKTAVVLGREVKTAVVQGKGVKTESDRVKGMETAATHERGVMTAVVHGRGVKNAVAQEKGVPIVEGLTERGEIVADREKGMAIAAIPGQEVEKRAALENEEIHEVEADLGNATVNLDMILLTKKIVLDQGKGVGLDDIGVDLSAVLRVPENTSGKKRPRNQVVPLTKGTAQSDAKKSEVDRNLVRKMMFVAVRVRRLVSPPPRDTRGEANQNPIPKKSLRRKMSKIYRRP